MSQDARQIVFKNVQICTDTRLNLSRSIYNNSILHIHIAVRLKQKYRRKSVDGVVESKALRTVNQIL